MKGFACAEPAQTPANALPCQKDITNTAGLQETCLFAVFCLRTFLLVGLTQFLRSVQTSRKDHAILVWRTKTGEPSPLFMPMAHQKTILGAIATIGMRSWERKKGLCSAGYLGLICVRYDTPTAVTIGRRKKATQPRSLFECSASASPQKSLNEQKGHLGKHSQGVVGGRRRPPAG